jgi:hypothetical protein
LPGSGDKRVAAFSPDLEFQQDDIRGGARQQFQRFGKVGTLAHYFHIGLRRQEATKALPEESIIVDQGQLNSPRL